MTRQKNFALEGLRGIACLNVVLGHFLFSFFPYLAHDVRPYPGAVAKYWFEELLRYFPFTFIYLADSAVSVFLVLRCLAWVATISVWKHEIEFGCEQVNHGFEVAD